MRIGRLTVVGLLAIALNGVAPGLESGDNWGGSEAEAGKKKRSGKKKSRKGKRDRYFSGHGVDAEELRTEPVPRPSGDLWIYSANLREEVRVNIFGGRTAPGDYDDAALAELDAIFRCKRTGERRAVDPRVYERLSTIQDHYGKRIELVSGFRFQENEGSRHYHASAADFRLEGVSNRELYQFAQSLDEGGMGIGIYPRSQFVHIDYRAPGEPSYRWTDRSPPDGNSKGKRPSRRARSKKPNT